jgi:hypothetical protein
VYPILRPRSPSLHQHANPDPYLVTPHEPLSGTERRVYPYGESREQLITAHTRERLQMKPMNEFRYPNRHHRGQLQPLRGRFNNKHLQQRVELFTFRKYVKSVHGSYYKEMPSHLKYLFAKFAYSHGLLTKLVRFGTLFENTIKVPPHLRRNYDEDGGKYTEPADMVYLSDSLFDAFNDAPPEQDDLDENGGVQFAAANFMDLVHKVDAKFADLHAATIRSRLVPTDLFLFRMVPRMYSQTAMLLYEEYMPDWFKIAMGYEEMIEQFTKTVQFVRPLNAMRRYIATEIGKCHAKDGPPQDRLTCTICVIRERRCVFLPCKHCVCCEDCAKTWRASHQECPLCRATVTDTMNFFLS